MKSEHQQRVEQFMRLAGQDAPSEPTMPNQLIRYLRAKLILEESLETIMALGYQVSYGGRPLAMRDLDLSPDHEPNLIEIIDGCCDVSVVTVGTMIACGLPMEPFLELVDANNIAKGEGGYVREDGKFMKPANHPKPPIKELLETLQG